jgi:hypothetical protein
MQTVRVDQLAKALAQCVRDGIKSERERNLKLINEFMCYDHQTLGRCDHLTCYDLSELKDAINAT